jgi:hypothetical protein
MDTATTLAWILVQVLAGFIATGVAIVMAVFGWILIGDFIRAWFRKPWHD